MENEKKDNSVLNYFDRMIGSLQGLPDVVKTKPTTMRVVPTFGLGSYVYVVQTFRQKEIGDIIFLENVSENGTVRVVIPPAVADVIARQRDQLSKRNRSRASRQAMADRMARGEKPGFMKHK
jgi:hypothetical protein